MVAISCCHCCQTILLFIELKKKKTLPPTSGLLRFFLPRDRKQIIAGSLVVCLFMLLLTNVSFCLFLSRGKKKKKNETEPTIFPPVLVLFNYCFFPFHKPFFFFVFLSLIILFPLLCDLIEGRTPLTLRGKTAQTANQTHQRTLSKFPCLFHHHHHYGGVLCVGGIHFTVFHRSGGVGHSPTATPTQSLPSLQPQSSFVAYDIDHALLFGQWPSLSPSPSTSS